MFCLITLKKKRSTHLLKRKRCVSIPRIMKYGNICNWLIANQWLSYKTRHKKLGRNGCDRGYAVGMPEINRFRILYWYDAGNEIAFSNGIKMVRLMFVVIDGRFIQIDGYIYGYIWHIRVWINCCWIESMFFFRRKGLYSNLSMIMYFVIFCWCVHFICLR